MLSILNHDCAIASAAARMASAAGDRPLIEMGSRRTHEESAVAAARAAYLAGFSATSNLEAGRRYGIPTAGHRGARLHPAARHRGGRVRRRRSPRSASAPRCWSTPTTSPPGIATAVEVAGPELGAVRIDSGDLGVLTRAARAQLDGLGAVDTRIVLSGDLDEYAIAALRAEPVDVVRGRHVAGHRVRRADRRDGLQAGRGRRPAGGEAQCATSIPRRAQVGAAPAQGQRHRDRGGGLSWSAVPRRTPAPDDRVLPVAGRCAAASRSTTCPPWTQSRAHLRRVAGRPALGGAEAVRRRARHPDHAVP